MSTPGSRLDRTTCTSVQLGLATTAAELPVSSRLTLAKLSSCEHRIHVSTSENPCMNVHRNTTCEPSDDTQPGRSRGGECPHVHYEQTVKRHLGQGEGNVHRCTTSKHSDSTQTRRNRTRRISEGTQRANGQKHPAKEEEEKWEKEEEKEGEEEEADEHRYTTSQ